MRLIGFDLRGTRRIGRLNGETVDDLGAASDFYRDPKTNATSPARESFNHAELTIAPAVPETSRIFCVGINYLSHAGESKTLAGIDLPRVPMVFGRWQQSLIVDGEAAPVPPTEDGLDWEVELAAIVGKKYRATIESAPDSDVVFAYAAFNDLSARRKQLETQQFTLGKNADRSGPISTLTTADSVGDISQGLRVTTRVNGEVMQDGNTRDLIHDLSAIITYIADTVTLLPGDVIATGTPGGVGAGMNPQRFLHPGDEVEVEVERVGIVRTPIVLYA